MVSAICPAYQKTCTDIHGPGFDSIGVLACCAHKTVVLPRLIDNVRLKGACEPGVQYMQQNISKVEPLLRGAEVSDWVKVVPCCSSAALTGSLPETDPFAGLGFTTKRRVVHHHQTNASTPKQELLRAWKRYSYLLKPKPWDRRQLQLAGQSTYAPKNRQSSDDLWVVKCCSLAFKQNQLL